MENRDNVIDIEQGATNPGRSFWSFRYPQEVVRDCSMSVDEKRAILAAWASDEHAVESLHTLRHLPGTPIPVTFSSIMDARIELDRLSGFDNDDEPPAGPRPARRLPAQSHRQAA